jgi:PAS domain-containing protein
MGNVTPVDDAGHASRSLPLILARELAANLSTPMFLLDAAGMLVFFNEAAELLIGRTFAELGEIPGLEFGDLLHLRDLDDTPMRRRDSPAGIAFFQRRPAHRFVRATGFDGATRDVEATAYPLFGAAGHLHGVVTVFWQPSRNHVDATASTGAS